MKQFSYWYLALPLFLILACQEEKATNTDTTTDNPAIQVNYPTTDTITHTDEYHGKSIQDPYRWLEDDRSEATGEWVKAENKATFGYLDQIPYRNKIKERLTELWDYEKYSAPFQEGDYTYFYKNDGLQNQSVLYRQKGDGAAEVFLDPNTFSEDGTTSLAGMSFTKDGSLAAYSISEGGSDWRKIIVLNAETQKVVEDTLVDVKFSGISWRGKEGFYYSSYDKPKEGSTLSGMTQYHKLYFHRLGTPQSEDQLIFGGAATPRRYIRGYVTEDQRWLAISAANSTSGNELYLQDLTTANATIIPIVTNFENDHYIAHSEENTLYAVTNWQAPNRRLVKFDIANPTTSNWEDVIAERKEPLSLSTGGGYFFARYLKDALSYVEQIDLSGEVVRQVNLPGQGSANGFGGKWTQQQLYYSFVSYIDPSTIYSFDASTGVSEVYKKSGVQFDPSEYESKQVFYSSKDGTKVPMMITHKKGLELDGQNPAMLYGYGGFNISLTPRFSTSNIVWLENGGIYAVPNLRGGGEYGKEWHIAGTKMNKQNVFDDFIAAAEYLIAEGYTSSEKLAIAGGSNGGLLVGATMTQRPDLMQVALPAVGVLDMLRYDKFTAGAGWAYDYGTAEESPEMFEYLKNYSPLHNLDAGTCYPATMVTTADHDDRVVPAHSFKFAATLQQAQGCDQPTLIRIETNAGHGAGKSTEKIIEEQTDKWAFTFYNLNAAVKYIDG
ncbi:MAG: prolyl oligopeptidase family serine peptidase [Bacteroidota bacterium]